MVFLVQRFFNKEDGGHFTQYLTVFTATITLFTAGIYQGWGGPSLMKILSDDFPIEVTEEEASYMMIIGPLGHVAGGFLASHLADFIGRKYTVLAIGLPQLLSFIVIYVSYYNIGLLYVARILGGLGEGASLALLPCYIAEVAEPSVRGSLGSFPNLLLLFGQLFINLVGSYLSIHVTALICLAFPIIFWITFVHMPESPYYCFMKEDEEGARKSLQTLRRKLDVDKELKQLALDVNRQMSEKGSYGDLFRIYANKKAFFLVSVTRIIQVFTGSIALMSYQQVMLSQATDLSPILASVVLITSGIVMVIVASFYIDKAGRKLSLFYSSTFTCLALLSQGIFLTVRDYTHLDISKVSWLPLPIMLLYNIAFRGGLGVVTNIFTSEIYSASIKAKAMSLGGLINAISMIISTKLYQIAADYVGLAVPFYIFAFTTFLGTLFFYFVLPETKGKSLERIQQELKCKQAVTAAESRINFLEET
ncbi:facilitated trehalose transporter Tret1-like [Anthonomus grandis grandis]|uniref:facilitated trehalose transporter Tret1-like n=1 Tax=Anthonomus grandis grandis TaxID=2921223 RepID=UPI002165A4F1|nr:facilitated trehalose transporter Tret1-like [Anthonomus grandis grandis]XP_050298939.1 facilitated trehalose transporter Tret1-like [Anthonomus grandis grandis]